MPLVKTLNSIYSGGVSWVRSDRIPLNDFGTVLNQRYMSPITADDESVLMFGDDIFKNYTFVAPEDLTIKKLVALHNNILPTAPTIPGLISDITPYLGLREFTIAGTGPDAGYNLVNRIAPPSMAMFSLRNIGLAPDLNVRMRAGDTITLGVSENVATSASGEGSFANSFIITYDDYDEGVTPIVILGGGPLEDYFSVDCTGGTPAAGGIQVSSAPSVGTISLYSFKSQTEYLLTSGTGAAGTDTYDSTAATVTDLRNSILTAINDTTNSWGDENPWLATTAGAANIVMTRNENGAGGNYDRFDSDSADFNFVTPTAGTSTEGSKQILQPGFDVVVTGIYYSAFTNDNFGPIISPAIVYENGFELTRVEKNFINFPIGRGGFPPMLNRIGYKSVNIPLAAGDDLDLFFRCSLPNSSNIVMPAVVAERA